VKNKLVMGS